METRVASHFGPLMSNASEEELVEVKKGPWTEDEDALLMNYVSIYGEGHWNSVARLAGLKRTGKSCRLRWLNYLRPDLRRGNITLQEQLLILELHSHWGNRWSKIAQYLPGRTDNEIKNYWRTRVQKQAKQMKCDVNSKQFRDAMRFIWMPRLRERIQSSAANTSLIGPTNSAAYSIDHPISHTSCNQVAYQAVQSGSSAFNPGFSSEIPAASSQSYSDNIQGASLASDPSGSCTESITEGLCSWPQNLPDEGDLMMENLWNEENMLFLQQQLFDDD